MSSGSIELNIVQSFILLVVFLFIRLVINGIVKRTAKKHEFDLMRKQVIIKTVNFTILFMIFIFLVGIWGLKGTQIFTFLASILAVIGVAFFAQWSLLSNITAGLILFFNHPIKIGQHISIVDSTPYLAGKVIDIALFFMHIKDENGKVYIVPNSIVIQKTLIIVKNEEDLKQIEEDLKGEKKDKEPDTK